MKALLLLTCAAALPAADLRVGIIGTDTSHVPAFTQLLNSAPDAKDHVAGARVVAAYKGGSKDIESSISRIDEYSNDVRTKWGVEIVGTIPELLSKVDAVLLSSVDGRVHLEQVKPVLAAHKPVFIDKPLAASYADALEIARLAKAAGVPWFSSSSLRYGEIATSLKAPGITGALTWGPGPLEPHHQLDLSWYAIHPVELLYTLMGPGCAKVTRIAHENADEIVGEWKDGRIGTVRAIRPYSDYGAVVFQGQKATEAKPQGAGSYRPLVVEIVKFFQTGVAPVSNEETLEIFAFLDAAQKSKDAGGKTVEMGK